MTISKIITGNLSQIKWFLVVNIKSQMNEKSLVYLITEVT
jgi:hypothetical protein